MLISYRRQIVTLNAETTRFVVIAFEPILLTDLNKKYTCIASNSLGMVSQEFQLNGTFSLNFGSGYEITCFALLWHVGKLCWKGGIALSYQSDG